VYQGKGKEQRDLGGGSGRGGNLVTHEHFLNPRKRGLRGNGKYERGGCAERAGGVRRGHIQKKKAPNSEFKKFRRIVKEKKCVRKRIKLGDNAHSNLSKGRGKKRRPWEKEKSDLLSFG